MLENLGRDPAGAYYADLCFLKPTDTRALLGHAPTRDPAEINLKADRVQYWIGKGAQPTDMVRRLIKQAAKNQASVTESQAEAA